MPQEAKVWYNNAFCSLFWAIFSTHVHSSLSRLLSKAICISMYALVYLYSVHARCRSYAVCAVECSLMYYHWLCTCRFKHSKRTPPSY